MDQEYVSAVGQAADAALASGRPQRILPLLRQFAASESLDESLQARLMLVLAANGQQALALAHYQQVRERLESELGSIPARSCEPRTAGCSDRNCRRAVSRS